MFTRPGNIQEAKNPAKYIGKILSKHCIWRSIRYLGVCFTKRSRIASERQGAIVVVSKRGFTPFSAKWWVGIGHDVVLVFGFSGVMISMKSIDMYILHDSSLGVCFANRSRIAS